ncbi:MAG: pilus assembly protein PilM [Desulfosporosinus sp.]|nr:pilus assembly protein PilM [Desulfosporosinus sp.]
MKAIKAMKDRMDSFYIKDIKDIKTIKTMLTLKAMKSVSILSLDIGSMLIKAVVGKEVRNGVEIEKAFLFNTPIGTVSDGHILDVATLGAEIQNQLEIRQITTKQIIFSISSTEVVTRELLLPSVKNKEIRQLIVFEVDKLLPIQLEQYILDYSVLENIAEDLTNKSRILVAALPKIIAEGYWQLANQLQLKPLSLTIHACSITQLFQQQVQLNGRDFDPNNTVVFLDLGYKCTECNVISKGKLLFHRTVNLGGKSFISENVFPSIAQGEIAANGLSLEPQTMPFNTQENNFELINMEKLGNWLQEIRRVIWYFTGMNSENKIDNIILIGGCTEDVPGLAAYVEDVLKIRAEVLENISLVSSEKNGENSLKYYLNAIGAIKRN